MILTAACATRWWTVEIEFEALAQDVFVDFAMRPCQAAPAFDTTQSTPPKAAAI